MLVTLDGTGALYDQLYRALRASILAGRLAPGSRLPSTRDLAAELGLSRNTVVTAYEQLQAEGYVEGRLGSGTYVASQLPDEGFRPDAPGRANGAGAAEAPRWSRFGQRLSGVVATWQQPKAAALPYAFTHGRPAPRDLPVTTLRRLYARRLRAPGLSELDYGPPAGVPELREAVAQHLARARGVVTSPERVVVVSGSQQALDLAARLLLDRGDRVILEELHYGGARLAFAAAGAEFLGAPNEDEGLDVGRFGRKEASARLVYVTPSHQFPTGAVMSLPRRLALLDWAEQHGAFVFEDDYDSEYRYGGRPLQALQGLDRAGRVIYAGTFSKLLYPSLRIGYLVLPDALVAPFVTAKALTDTGNACLDQLVLADFIREGSFERHLRRSRARNARRRAALVEAVERHLGKRVEMQGTASGLHVLVWIRGVPGPRARELAQRAAQVGVAVDTVNRHALAPQSRAGLLLGYTLLDEARIDEGIRRLASVL